MNSKERVLGVLQGNTVDRRPFTALLSLYGARLIRCPLEKYYKDAAAYARGQTAVRETFQPDILFSPFLLAVFAEAFGGEAKYFDNAPPNLLRPAITSKEEILGLSVPDIDSHPRIVYVRDSLRRVVETHGKDVVVAGSLLSPIDLPLMIMGLDKWMEIVLFDQDGVKRMLEITIPFFLQYANALLKDGADLLVLPAAFLTPSLVSQEIVERFTLPILHDIFTKVRGPMIIHHVGGSFLKFLDLFTGLPNVKGFVLDHQDNLSVAREKVGPGVTLLGGLDGPNIGKILPGEVEERCTYLLRDRQKDPSFILCTTGADVAYDTPLANINAMRKAVESFQVDQEITERPQIVCIACTIYRKELEALRERGLIDFTIRYLDSKLHMIPKMLDVKLVTLLDKELDQGHKVLLVYGGCSTHMVDLAGYPGVARVKGASCGDIFLGREQNRKLSKEKAFLLFPEWTLRWREVLGTLMDLDQETTIEIMRESHMKLVYLDTGVCPVPEDELKACSKYFDLPYEVLSVSLDNLYSVINNAITELKIE